MAPAPEAAEKSAEHGDPIRPNSLLDSSLQHFTDPSFDPVDFLNNTLPPLARAPSQHSGPREPGAVSLAELSTQTQTLLSQLSAQNARLSNTLTQLTDEILRGSGRLAYEVEILRGETIGLSDTLAEGLGDDIQRFVPGGLAAEKEVREETTPIAEEGEEEPESKNADADLDPQFVKQLRTLSLVRNRLDEVIHTFGEAMEWPLPPSELSITSSFISVSAPEPGPEQQSREEKGREVAKKLRTEVMNLLDSNGGGDAGVEAATNRVEALRELANVWKGTAEERARIKFVDTLARLVDERRRILEQGREKEQRDSSRKTTRSPSKAGRSSTDSAREERGQNQENSGGGLLRNLQRLRDEIYLD